MAKLASLGDIIKSSQKGFLKEILLGAGLTLGVSGSLMILFNQMLGNFKSSLNSLPAEIMGLAHIAGFDVFFSLILGAYAAKYTLDSGKLALKRAR